MLGRGGASYELAPKLLATSVLLATTAVASASFLARDAGDAQRQNADKTISHSFVFFLDLYSIVCHCICYFIEESSNKSCSSKGCWLRVLSFFG